MLVSLNKGKAAMLVSPINPPGIEFYSYANVSFCFVWKTCSLVTWVKTLYMLIFWHEVKLSLTRNEMLSIIYNRHRYYCYYCYYDFYSKDEYFAFISLSVIFNHRIQSNGLCDRRKRPCEKTTVQGLDFLNSTNMTCHIREIQVGTFKTISDGQVS